MSERVALYFVASPLQYLAARRIAENFEAGARQVLVWYKPGVTPIVREADWDAAGYMPWPRWEPLPGPFGRHRRLRDNIRRVAALVGPCDSLHIHSAVFDTEAINYFLRALPKACGAPRAAVKNNFFTNIPPGKVLLMKELILIYLLIINAVAFLLMLVDKLKAKKHLWRIPESTLMTSALLGGSVGALLGMYTVRHKTKHKKFTIGIPLILFAQIALAVLYFAKFASISAVKVS